MAAHAIRDNEKSQLLIDAETVFIVAAFNAGIRFAEYFEFQPLNP
jgi:hypothetical protein